MLNVEELEVGDVIVSIYDPKDICYKLIVRNITEQDIIKHKLTSPYLKNALWTVECSPDGNPLKDATTSAMLFKYPPGVPAQYSPNNNWRIYSRNGVIQN